MLNYNSEVWGLDADHTPIERVHLFALKRFLNTSLRTPKLMVYGETGRYPLFVNVYVKCIRKCHLAVYHFKIIKCCCIYMNKTRKIGHPLFAMTMCYKSMTLVMFW